jgi:beta-xylosidase
VQAKRRLKRLLWRSAPALYRRAQSTPPREYSIGILTGRSPFALERNAANPVLTRQQVSDIPAMLVADPFMCHTGGYWYLFFEVVNHLTRKGEIGVAVSRDAVSWEYRGIVLTEPFHLSYPYVFEWQGEHYMIPESSRGGTVSLYRATEFPLRWTPIAALLEGQRFADASIFRYEDEWWMFADAGRHPQRSALHLYHSKALLGPWQKHPANPIVSDDPHIARPAGRVIVVDGSVVRFAQDGVPVYGSKVHALRVTRLTSTEYAEEPASDRVVLAGGSDEWNRDGMHHIDAHQRPDGSWIACVDGFRLRDERKTRMQVRSTSSAIRA